MTSGTELLDCVEVGPRDACDLSVIWLHGLGADGHDFPPIVPHLQLDPKRRVRFVFPHAPPIPVTINGGMVMRAWYDIRPQEFLDPESVSPSRHDMEGVRRSARQVQALLEREVERGVPARDVVLAGFSQGGAIALYLGLRYPQPLRGIVALSTYLVGGDTLAAEVARANREIAVFQGHGTMDPMVRFERGEALRDRLIEIGCDVTFREYPMEHAVCLEEIVDLGAWLNAIKSVRHL